MTTFVGSRALTVPQPKNLCAEFLLRHWSPVHQGVGFDLAVSGSVGKGISPPSLLSHFFLLHPFSVLTMALDATMLASQRTGRAQLC